jgi:hypothetical protein
LVVGSVAVAAQWSARALRLAAGLAAQSLVGKWESQPLAGRSVVRWLALLGLKVQRASDYLVMDTRPECLNLALLLEEWQFR